VESDRRSSHHCTKSEHDVQSRTEISQHLGNASYAMQQTVPGITTERKDELQSALASIRFSFEFDSKENDESEIQFEKLNEPRISTLRGITIDGIIANVNAWDSIRFNIEFGSNEMNETDLHRKKHDRSRISMSRGITIVFE
jgi:hypothetical protein